MLINFGWAEIPHLYPIGAFLVVALSNHHSNEFYRLEKLEEYERKGIPNIWLIDPRLQKMSVYANGDLHEIRNDVISTSDGQIAITREEIFRDS